MKIFDNSQIHELDKYTIEHEPIASIDLMERAATAVTHAIVDVWHDKKPVVVFAGPGNNGGDALAVARLMAGMGYPVDVFLFNVKGKLSPDCEQNKKRIVEGDKVKSFTEVTLQFDLPKLNASTLVVDGLFGSGLNKPLSGGFASLVKYINQSESMVVSIDVPSGLMSDDNTYNIQSNIVCADLTLTLQQKKLAFMFADCQRYIGRLKVLDIGLSREWTANADAQAYTVEENDIRDMMLIRDDFAHKGTMGDALIIAGSYGMAGAAVLATKACLRAGAGKVTTHTPKNNYEIMQISVPEAVLQIDRDDQCFSDSVEAEQFDALGIGPGLGTRENTAIALIAQLRRTRAPIVIDADALNILANHNAWLQQLPDRVVMTPHPGELDRLAGGRCANDFERLSKARAMAERYNAYIILKGHYSALCLPDGHVAFNTTGNSGMATAGSGDVLTGIITSLLARGYTQEAACKTGMFLHGLAGDLAAKDKGKESLIASDLIEYLPKAFRWLEN